jgi:hypothetical protein
MHAKPRYTAIMDSGTAKIVGQAIAAFSALCGAIATVAALFTIKLARDSNRIQREEREADQPKLDVVVNPTRNGPKQLAQITVINRSRRPAHVQAWDFGNAKWGGQSFCTLTPPPGHPYGGTLPKILAAQERVDLLVEFGDFDWRKLERIGVIDIDNHHWIASPENLKSFLRTAEQFAPLAAEV